MLERSYNDYIDFVSEAMPRIRQEMKCHGDGQAVLLAATKTVPSEVINYAIDRLGLEVIGENRVQELLDKYDALHKENLHIHFIGRLQTNKVKYIIDKVDLIHSVDSERLAKEIDRQAKKHHKVMEVLVEVNLGGEASKGGVAPEKVGEFLDSLASYDNLSVEGLMAIPPAGADHQTNVKYFQQIHQIFIDILQKKLHNKKRYILSMGMSDSYIEALDCGSNMIRLGSALFGRRIYPPAPGESEIPPDIGQEG